MLSIRADGSKDKALIILGNIVVMTNTTDHTTGEILARYLTDSLTDAKVVVYDKHS